jgi:hypothetical protein
MNDMSLLPLDGKPASKGLPLQAVKVLSLPSRESFNETDTIALAALGPIDNEHYGYERIWLDDGFLLSLEERTLSICKGILDEGLKFFWHCSARVDPQVCRLEGQVRILSLSSSEGAVRGLGASFGNIQKADRHSAETRGAYKVE